MTKRAGLVLIVKDGLVLSVSRGSDTKDLGLPGGKLEEDESFSDGACRELFEETGLKSFNLSKIYCGTHNGWIVKTFTPANYFGKIKNSNEGEVSWVEPVKLTTGTFGKYNSEMLSFLGML